MDHDDDALPIGTLLANEYRIDSIVGAGGFGITYRARDVKLDIDVAIKEYFPRDFASRSNTVTVRPRSKAEVEPFQWGLSQFIEEARRLARLQHPNIVRCMRYFENNDTGYFVMTFEEGCTLDKYFSRPPQQSELDALLVPLLDALEALHAAGIYHRDISPDNILVRDDDTPVLIDFGASRQSMARRTQTVAAIVKPGYSPIEQYDRETRQQGAWSDIYALGATIYSVIAGGPPPDALSRVRSDSYVSAREAARGAYRGEFLDAIDWALETDPDQRPVTVREWRRKLLPNPSRARDATAMTKFSPATDGARALATRFLGKGARGKDAAKGAGGLRWPDYVLRGAALVMLAVFLARMFGGSGEQRTEAAPEPVLVGDAEERRLLASDSNAEAVWKRAELVLRRLGYLRGTGTAMLSEIRTGLKGYQHAIGQAETGLLNPQTLNRLLEESVELDPYLVPGAAVHGRWFLAKNQDECRITTGATRVEGRTVLTQRPFMEFGRKRSQSDETFNVALVDASLFDVASPLSFSAGTAHQILKYDGTDVVMGDNSEGNPTREVTRTLRFHRGEVVVSGTSAYGGTLKLAFPTDGFEDAFRAMAAECGEGIVYWIDDWGAVAKDSGATVWHAVGYGSQADAQQAAMASCAAKSQSGGCESYASFRDQCWVLSAGERSKDDWASGWGADYPLDAAKKLSLEACADDGGKNCEFITHICADGSNEWHASSD
ncbi:protein kinase [Hyphomicrobium sp.]|uniref:protein kinase domain-containing protein n=1 Tax=Hyphomicrobium sp. TaxID=82 RepID=UPI0025C4EBE6|nr:protein kinase [Hyphomicrobium sp.]MCC7250607.1 protein kinase [Hyphomicrobium sp.]